MELIKLENNRISLNENVSKNIAEFENAIKELKAKEDELKQNILKEMEEKGILKVETNDIIINYIESTDRETFDTKTFREEHSDLYDEYIKITPVKSSIRIKIK